MKMFSLFSGIRGLDIAAHAAGIDTAAYVEIDSYCQKVIAHYDPNTPIFSDIRGVSALTLQRAGVPWDDIDIIAGGFPCQDISCAGKGKGLSGDRSGLWYEMRRLIKQLRPRWVLAENVPALRTRGADTVLSQLAELEYTAWPCVVGAEAVGAPHRRHRVFILAYTERVRRDTGRKPLRWEAWADAYRRSAWAAVDDANGFGQPQPGRGFTKRRGWTGDTGEAMAVSLRSGRHGEPGQQGEGSTGRGRARQDGETILADTLRAGREERHLPTVTGNERYVAGGDDSGAMGHAESNCQRPGQCTEAPGGERRRRSGDAGTGQSQPFVGLSADGFPCGLLGPGPGGQWPAPPGDQYEWEPPRTEAGVAGRAQMLKALGNAVVWQQAYPFFAAIAAASR